MEIRPPETAYEWETYYDLRFRILRAPWNQPQGSERNEGDKTEQHFAVWMDGKAVAVARMDRTDENGTVQVRFVAVENNHQGKGLGKILMQAVERAAKERGNGRVILHARENALSFYKALGYSVVEKSYLLFDEIQHYLMEKEL